VNFRVRSPVFRRKLVHLNGASCRIQTSAEGGTTNVITNVITNVTTKAGLKRTDYKVRVRHAFPSA